MTEALERGQSVAMRRAVEGSAGFYGWVLPRWRHQSQWMEGHSQQPPQCGSRRPGSGRRATHAVKGTCSPGTAVAVGV